MFGELATRLLNDVKIKFVPLGSSCKLWPWEPCNGLKIKPVDDEGEEVGNGKDKCKREGT